MTWLIRIKIFLEWAVSTLLALVDWLEDIIEDLEISTDPEIRRLMKEARKHLSPGDVV